MDKKYFERQRLRINQKIKVLVSYPDFQKKITQLREKWNIPFNGIDNEKENYSWQEWLNTKSEEYFNNIWPRERELEEKLIKEGKLMDQRQANLIFNKNIPINNFRNDILEIVKKYKLPLSWDNSIKRYLIFNDSENMDSPLGNVSIILNFGDNGVKTLTLELNANTTIRDIKNIWPQVENEQKKLNDRTTSKFQPIKNIDRDKRVFELAEQGLSYEKIAEKIIGEFEVAESFGYDNISKILNRIRKRFGH